MAITSQGIGQPDLDTYLRSIATLLNELRTDRAEMSDSYDSMLGKLDLDAGITGASYAVELGTSGSVAAWPADPASAALDATGFTSIDMSQEDMTDYLATVDTLIDELKADRTTMGASYTQLLQDLDADGGVNETTFEARFGVGGASSAWPAIPASDAVDDAALSAQGVSQPDLYDLLEAIETLGNEMKADRALMEGSYGEMLKQLDGDSGVADTDYYSSYRSGTGTEKPWPSAVSADDLDLG